MQDIVFRVVGEAGEGVISLGEIIARTSARLGYRVLTHRTYPAEIRGGPTMYQARVSTETVFSQGDGIDILLALNPVAHEPDSTKLKAGSVFLYDVTDAGTSQRIKEGTEITYYPLPLTEIASKELNYLRGKNMVALGIMAALFKFPHDLIREQVRHKYPQVEKNLRALETGFQYGKLHIDKKDSFQIRTLYPKEDRIILTGNEAVALAALAAGCRFFAGYPITPATEIMEWLAKKTPQFGGTVLQMEDEMAALAAALGASFAGNRAMTATSGPGLSLMTELLGLASMAELPIVVIDVQRAGPSTGIPTKTNQSHLNLACFSSHGDAPRIILAPSDVEECLSYTIHGFNLAEIYQNPVILLTDQFLGQRLETILKPGLSSIPRHGRSKYRPNGSDKFFRYELTPNGISPVAFPGEAGGMHVITGLEHNVAGAPDYSPETHQTMMAKRHKKLETVSRAIEATKSFGDPEAELGIIGWGSSQGAVQEAINRAQQMGYRVSALYIKLLSPFPLKQHQEFTRTVKKILIPETNYSGQLARLIRSELLISPIQLNNCTGRPFSPEEIYKRIEEEIA
jgi:2-oxoglutarate ferredoxin oxidoreductase subunit alpha